MKPLRIGIIGCGKIADQHVLAIHRIPNCEIVGLCDREILMARQLGERFGITQCFSELEDLLRTAKPDVIHVTTPPQSHVALARQCLEAGCHVYVEKPFTINSEEAEVLLEIATGKELKLIAGHNLQFTPEMLEMRRLVDSGFLGGKPVHLESHWSYSIEDPTWVKPILASREHWVRRLPGQIFHNIISHGIAKLAEFLDDELVEIVASAHQSPELKSLGGQEIQDELRVMLRDSAGTTAYFCFTTQVRPGLNHLRICGPANSLSVDHASGSLIRYRNQTYKSYLSYFVPPLNAARENFRNARGNLKNFFRRRLYQDYGMKEIIERFYTSIRAQAPPPIPYNEILRTVRIMDEIFGQISRQKTDAGILRAKQNDRKQGEGERANSTAGSFVLQEAIS